MEDLNFRALRHTVLVALFGIMLGTAGCGGSDGDDGAPGPTGESGADGSDGFSCWDLNENGVPDPEEDLNGDGVVNVLDCNATANARIIPIGDGTTLTEEQVEQIGRLQAEIKGVTIASPPVVDFTVKDSNGNPAVGLAQGVVWFTMAKLVPGDPSFNGGLPYWQSYVNRIETPTEGNPAGSPNVLDSALQATADSGGKLEEPSPGVYRYTFATDVTDPEQTLGIEYEPGLTTRVGLEIRLGDNESDPANIVEVEVPLAPFNPVYDFVPNDGVGSGVTKAIADTMNCSSCHYQFEMHGGPRKSVEYCVTCHNPGSIDQDTGESIDMAYLAHSIHPGHDRNVNGDSDQLIPYIVWGYGEQFGFGEHDYSEVTYPQSLTYCENCHVESETHPDGNAWNEAATAKTCGGCHADGLEVGTPDAVTGQPDAYAFNHQYADVNFGIAEDGTCATCHLGAFPTAGPALELHSAIDGDQRLREDLGKQFVFSFVSATDTGAGQAPTVVFRVDKTDGTAWDIVNDPEFSDDNGASLNLYLAWNASETYNGTQDGGTGGARDRGPVDGTTIPWQAGHPYRVYLAALQADAVQQADGSYQYTFFEPLPADLAGDAYFALGGHPAGLGTVLGGSGDPADDGTEQWQRAAATSAVFYPDPDARRDYRADNEGCNGCHQQIQLHGSNRNGNTEMCLVCHNADQAGERSGATAGWSMGYMVHNIHVGNPDYWTGEFAEITYPQSIANCFTCHTDAVGSYSVARTEARAVSTGEDDSGLDFTWLNDVSTTPNAAVCGACHRDNAAQGHFLSNGAQIGELKQDIVGASTGFPNGQEACAVCHGSGSTFDSALFHNTAE
jgi:OmcA/MtrC family decaheme c-type cytochrome